MIIQRPWEREQLGDLKFYSDNSEDLLVAHPPSRAQVKYFSDKTDISIIKLILEKIIRFTFKEQQHTHVNQKVPIFITKAN